MRIVRSARYVRDLEKLQASEAGVDAVERAIAVSPEFAPMMQGLRGLREARFRIGNRGKSGGGRAIYYAVTADETIFMIAAYDKSQKNELPPDERRSAQCVAGVEAMRKRTKFGRALEEGLREALAWKRGEIELEVRIIEPMPPARVKAIRKRAAKSPREFERRFGVPARTLEGWEQGKKVDVAARVLLTVIENEPEAVERALAAE